MTRKRRPLAALVLVSVIALIGSGCGSSAPADTTSAAASSSATGGTSVGTKASKREKAVKFAECVRAHGVLHFPDPDTAGNFNFGVDVSAAVFTNAVNACKALQPPGSLSGHRSTTQQSAALRFAQCVRANGVSDFPDPVNGQPLIDTTKISSSNQPGGMTILNAATHKCGSVLRLAAGGGTG
ncbi:MAG: hypothetical protein WCB67_03680 [Solirubrobacteraceae bacterium]